MVSNKMECFIYEDGCGVCGHVLSWATDKQFQVISNRKKSVKLAYVLSCTFDLIILIFILLHLIMLSG